MQRLGGGVKADIARHDARFESLVKRLIIGAIGHKTALEHHTQEIGFRMVGHGRLML